MRNEAARLFGAAMGHVLVIDCVVSDFPDWI
jgi:hypothetical protein